MSIIQRYDDPVLAKQYDLGEKGSRHGDIEAYVKLLKHTKGPVLELGCGSGRITIPLKKCGVNVMGLDLAGEMVKLARAYAKKERLAIPFKVADAVTFKLPQKFDAIIFPYNSLRQIPESKIPTLLRNVSRHLKPKGLFIFDISQHAHDGYKDISYTPWSEPMDIPGTKYTLSRRMKRTDDVKRHIWTIVYHWKIQQRNLPATYRKTTMAFSTRPTDWYIKQCSKNGLALFKRRDMSVKTHHGKSTHSLVMVRKT